MDALRNRRAKGTGGAAVAVDPNHPLARLLNDLRAHPQDVGVMENVIDDLIGYQPPLAAADIEELESSLKELREPLDRGRPAVVANTYQFLVSLVTELLGRRGGPRGDPWAEFDFDGGRRRKSQAKRFGSCVKAVRKTVKARKGSTAEGAAIAICTTTLLHPRGRTIKRYRKGRLLTQRRR
jgi:hypothetical protein